MTRSFSTVLVVVALAMLSMARVDPTIGATYYVAPSGNDALPCEATTIVHSPRQTIAGGMACLTEGGDTLLIREGTYEESLIVDTNSTGVPHGQSWDLPVTIRAFEGEKVTIRPGRGEAVVAFQHADLHHVVLDSLKIDATGSSYGLEFGKGVRHIRVQNSTISHARSHGIFVEAGRDADGAPSEHEFVNLRIIENGRSDEGGYGIVLNSGKNLVQGCTISDNRSGGIRIDNSQGNLVSNNSLLRNGQGGQDWGVRIERGADTIIYNNVLWQNASGLTIDNLQSHIYHNTVVGMRGSGMRITGRGDRPLMHNNIVSGHEIDLDIANPNAPNVSYNITAHQHFVDANAGNFHLSDTSPAINGGLSLHDTLAALLPDDIVDYDGLARPQHDGWDAGAFEFAGEPTVPPMAGFTATPTTGPAPLTTSFLDSSSGSIETWLWNFGDGTMSANRHPTHRYALAGTYSVSLTVQGPGGTHTTILPAFVHVVASPPDASFSAETRRGTVPLTVQFSNQSTGDITTWLWDFGDGTTSLEKQPTHTYTEPGVYSVLLEARGPLGEDQDRKPSYVVVIPPTGAGLLNESFSVPLSSDWQVVDEGEWEGPSLWSAHSGRLIQTSNIWSPPADRGSLPKPGTYLWYRPGLAWTDYQIHTTLRSDDDDTLGIMFRYKDSDNYYRFSWDQERNSRRLIKKVNGQFTLLAEESVRYERGQDYAVDLFVYGSTLDIRVNGQPLFDHVVTDSDLTVGSVGLYSWFNKGTIFEGITVSELLMPTTNDIEQKQALSAKP